MSKNVTCWWGSIVFYQAQSQRNPEIFEQFMLPADDLFGDNYFIFQQDLAPAHIAQTTDTCFSSYGILIADSQANSLDLNLGMNDYGK